jgi:hypothetical protein
VFPTSVNVIDWVSDPVLGVNEKTGAFCFRRSANPSGNLTLGIAVVKGTFAGSVFSWYAQARGVGLELVQSRQEWLAVDSTGTGRLYLAFSVFSAATENIQFARSIDDNATWSAPIILSSAGDAGLVQGSRIAIGPLGEVYVAWSAIGSGVATDFMRIRKSTTAGTTFGAEITPVSFYNNFGSGGPGFNRGLGFAFPGLAVDRGNGPHRSRAYLAWNESVDFFNDNLGNGSVVNEVDPTNDSPATATHFTYGNVLHGTISASNDLDYWSFDGIQGQTVIFLDTLSTAGLDASFRLFCTDGLSRLSFSEIGSGVGASGLIVYTLPTTGKYYVRVASLSGTGTYDILTGVNGAVTERARDHHRDVFAWRSSDGGTTWSTPGGAEQRSRVLGQLAPGGWVSHDGRVYCAWYDWRDSQTLSCGGSSETYLGRSLDGGATWVDGSPVSDTRTDWTFVNGNIAPNQGDYIGLFANAFGVYVGWADGRNSDPDVFMANVGLSFVGVTVSLASVNAQPDGVALSWLTDGGPGLVATVYRRDVGADWVADEQVPAGGSGQTGDVECTGAGDAS